MPRWEKTLSAMLSDLTPRSYTYQDLVSILEGLDFSLARRAAGSHRIWKRRISDPSSPSGTRTVSIGLVDSGSGTIKAVYVKETLRILRENNLLPSQV
ncbi:MAG: type II toxin-antitoxin system HicA family toxin [Gemmatimonadaceae bacterium]